MKKCRRTIIFYLSVDNVNTFPVVHLSNHVYNAIFYLQINDDYVQLFDLYTCLL